MNIKAYLGGTCCLNLIFTNNREKRYDFKMKCILSIFLLTQLIACSHNKTASNAIKKAPKVKQSLSTIALEHEYLVTKNDGKIEFYWSKPEGNGPFPVLLHIHGHQEKNEGKTLGAKQLADWEVMQKEANLGYVSAAISQPGYGESTGPADFCGPETQAAVHQVLNFLRSKKFVDAKRIGLQGISRGAIVASMVVTQDPTIAAAILISGSYDLKKLHQKLLKDGEQNPMLLGIAKNIEAESVMTTGQITALTKDSFKLRSAISHAKKIKTPLLILNGETDDRTSADLAVDFGRAVERNGTPVTIIVYPEYGHAIPVEERRKATIPFLHKYLK